MIARTSLILSQILAQSHIHKTLMTPIVLSFISCFLRAIFSSSSCKKNQNQMFPKSIFLKKIKHNQIWYFVSMKKNVIEINFSNSGMKAENSQKGIRNRKIHKKGYSNSERSEQFLKQNVFLTYFWMFHSRCTLRIDKYFFIFDTLEQYEFKLEKLIWI